jgi:hypothetical protein
MAAHHAPITGRSWAPTDTPARSPPTDWGEVVQVHDDRDVLQASHDELPAIDIHRL